MIVTESKSSIRYKESRRKWVPRAAEENVVIQNQTTCTIFHHQGGWWVRVEPTRQPPTHPLGRLTPAPTQKVYLHLTWEETGQINRSEGNKAKYVSSLYPVRTVYGKVLATYLFSLFVLLLSFLIDTADENYKRLLPVWRFFWKTIKTELDKVHV